MSNLKKIKYAILLFVSTALIYTSCKKEENTVIDNRTNTTKTPPNPFDSLTYPNDSITTDTLAKGTLASIYKNIFVPRCAVPGCHDGNFEPDFRTLASTYSTLVYHPIIKNNVAKSFTYRVIPGDTANSVLHERLTNCCFANQNDRMPQDNIGSKLEQVYIDEITTWIMNGAKNSSGVIAAKPDKEPLFKNDYYAIVDSAYNWVSNITDRLDTTTWISPVVVKANSSYIYIPKIKDDNTLVKNFTKNILKFSYSINNFSNPILEVNGVYMNFDGNENDGWFHQFKTTTFLTDTTIYMRYYMNDGTHTNDTEFPKNETEDYYKIVKSIYIKTK